MSAFDKLVHRRLFRGEHRSESICNALEIRIWRFMLMLAGPSNWSSFDLEGLNRCHLGFRGPLAVFPVCLNYGRGTPLSVPQRSIDCKI